MDHELAKQLKDAGFPQGDELYCACAFTTEEERKELDMDVVYDCATERVYKPTLEELIEACGGRILKLWVLADGRGGVQLSGQGLEEVVYYPTLKEAVARLWLALHPMNETHQGENRPTA